MPVSVTNTFHTNSLPITFAITTADSFAEHFMKYILPHMFLSN
jgi:hypothetical protein